MRRLYTKHFVIVISVSLLVISSSNCYFEKNTSFFKASSLHTEKFDSSTSSVEEPSIDNGIDLEKVEDISLPPLPTRDNTVFESGEAGDLSYSEIDFSLKIDERSWVHSPHLDSCFLSLLEKYSWYGDLGMFPFTAMTCAGLDCGEAEHIANKFYSTAVDYANPEGGKFVRQGSNYPQFNSESLKEYRWFWDGNWYSQDTPFLPRQPSPYQEPILLDVATIHWIFYDDFVSGPAMERVIKNEVSVDELAIQQVEWFYENLDFMPADPLYYELTGLCILNGDSRTEHSYFYGSRAKDIRITVNSEYVIETTLEDTPHPQFIDLNYRQDNMSTPINIQIECINSYMGEISDIFITEVGVGMDTNRVYVH